MFLFNDFISALVNVPNLPSTISLSMVIILFVFTIDSFFNPFDDVGLISMSNGSSVFKLDVYFCVFIRNKTNNFEDWMYQFGKIRFSVF